MLKILSPLENRFVVSVTLLLLLLLATTLLGSKHKSQPTFNGLWFQYDFQFPKSFQCYSVYCYILICHLRTVVYAIVQFSRPLLCFHKNIPHMLSLGISFRLHTQIEVIFFLDLLPVHDFLHTLCPRPLFLILCLHWVFWLPIPWSVSWNYICLRNDVETKKRGKTNRYSPHILGTTEDPFPVSLVKEKDYLLCFKWLHSCHCHYCHCY